MRTFALTLGLLFGTAWIATAAEADKSIRFKMHRIATQRYEACGVADFNGDGKPDVVAGAFIYLAPDWKPIRFRNVEGQVDEQGKGYYWDFSNIPMDVDGDGKLDVVTADWRGDTAWFKNDGCTGGLWKRTLIETKQNVECADLWDLDGKGKLHAIVPCRPSTAWYEAGTLPDGSRGIVKYPIAEESRALGGGVGDINGDGRPDVIRPDAWYEAPVDPRKGRWIAHPIALGGADGAVDHTPQILVFDVNGDGRNDIITSSAHKYGIFWYEQVRKDGKIAFVQHVIDKTWTQAHSLTLADLDGDGLPELCTGKRFMAHNGNDPDETGPLGVYYYQLQRTPNVRWTKHVVSFNAGIGSGMNLPVVDMNGDGKPDLVVTGKWGGPVWFENLGR